MAPICIFTYKRKASLEKLILSLRQNKESSLTDLFIFCDNAKDESEQYLVDEVRSFCRSINGFRSVKIVFSERNKGLADSIIEGVSLVLENHESAIILEDDLLVSKGFISFMNAGLKAYSGDMTVISVCGFSKRLPRGVLSNDATVYFHGRSSSWGWATWRDKWNKVDFGYVHNLTPANRWLMYLRLFLLAPDLPLMMRAQIKGKINSWAVRYVEAQSRFKMISLFPSISLVENTGFDQNATHCDVDIGFESSFNVDNVVSHQSFFARRLMVVTCYIWFYEAAYGLFRKLKRIAEIKSKSQF